MKLPIVLIAEDNLALISLRQKLEKEVDYLVENKIHGFDNAFELLRKRTGPVLIVVDLSRDPEKAFRVAHEIKFNLPNVHVAMTSPDSTPETILRAMRSGAEEFFTQPFNWPEVFQSLDRIRNKITIHSASAAKSEHGRIITVFSNKGGVGSTTVATNLSVFLAARKQISTCLVDLVLQFGSVTSFLNLDPTYTILDLVRNIKRIDPLLLDGSLVKHASGIRVLAEPFHAEDARRIKPADIEEILNTLTQSFKLVVIDSPKEFDETSFVALDKAQLILFVTEMDVPSLKSAHRAFELFDRMQIYPNKIRLVLNRYVKNKLMSLESVEKTLGMKVFWTLPNDYPTAIAALNQGLSILETEPKSALAKSYEGLADAVVETLSFTSGQRPEEERKKGGLFSRWIPARGAS
ncbi:MAG TPA: AAA family ATPase [Candidatus Acidoferrales bacterium]|nr:AAA family ATPase [Candidatus Acidoferrales bacterium]